MLNDDANSARRAENVESLEELTPRQRQILALLSEGKVNKEIANELKIGVGTVKQHVVALFKRLQVSNRAMAVARGGQLEQTTSVAQAEGLLQRRPCVILCVSLAQQELASPLVRRLHASLAALAFDHDALFLARKGNAGDLIFGINKVTEFDAIKALQVLQCLQEELQQALQEMQAQPESDESAESENGAGEHGDLEQADFTISPASPSAAANTAHVLPLRAALVVGLVVASMKRFGGWSGEAVASASISRGRSLLEQADAGQVLFSQSMQSLLLSFGLAEQIQACLSLQAISRLHWRGERPSYGMFGRQQEWQKLLASYQTTPVGTSRLLFLTGETGMGKSLLCRQFAETVQAEGKKLVFLRAIPAAITAFRPKQTNSVGMQNVLEEQGQSWSSAVLAMQKAEVVILDDCHLLSQSRQQEILLVLQQCSAFSVISTRRVGQNLQQQVVLEHLIHLQRLPLEVSQALMMWAWQASSGKLKEKSGIHAGKQLIQQMPAISQITNQAVPQAIQQLAALAAGVPLFGLELARQYAQEAQALPGLALAIIVSARLDELALDRQLLQIIAHSEHGICLEELKQQMTAKLSLLLVRKGSTERELAVEIDSEVRAGLQGALAAGVIQATSQSESSEVRWQVSHPLMRRVINWLAQEQI